jgi:hypothetical protein
MGVEEAEGKTMKIVGGVFFKYEGKHKMATENTTLRCWNHDVAEWLCTPAALSIQ